MTILTLLNLVKILEEPVSLLNVLEMADSENRSMKAAFVRWHKRLKVLQRDICALCT